MNSALFRLFLRSRSLRLSALFVVIAIAAIVNVVGVVGALRNGPDVVAVQTLGRADFVISMADSAPLGRTAETSNQHLANIVTSSGGSHVATDFMVPETRPDQSASARYGLVESSDRAYTYPSTRLLTGRWPTTRNEVVASAGAMGQLGSNPSLSFFGGALKLHVVGSFIDNSNRDENVLLMAPGTWEQVHGVRASRLATLDASATRDVYWSGTQSSVAFKNVEAYVSTVTQLKAAAQFNPPQLQARTQITSQTLSPIQQLQFAAVLAPLLAGVLLSVFAGRFITRTRKLLWAIGIGIHETRRAAFFTTIGVGVLAAILGSCLGLALFPLALLIADKFSNHFLSIQTGVLPTAASCLLFVFAGCVFGYVLVRPRVRERKSQQLATRANLSIAALVGFIGLTCVGLVSVQASTDPASVAVSGLALSAALLIALVAGLTLLLKLEPRSFIARIAVRRARADFGSTVVFSYMIGLLCITGVALSILLTSTYAAFNRGIVPPVPRDQIVFTPELPTDSAGRNLASKFQQTLQLKPPIVVNFADQGSDRGDGATEVVNTPLEAAAVVGTHLTSSQTDLLLSGGALTAHEDATGPTIFSPQPGFKGASLKSEYLSSANVSFRRRDSIILTSTAIRLGLHPVTPSFVFTDTTPSQRALVPRVVAELGIKQPWVETYRAPDTAVPPTAFLFVSGALMVVGALVSYAAAVLDGRGLSRSARTLRSIGVRRRSIAGLMALKVALTVVVAAVAGLIASFGGSAIAFSFGRLKVPLTVPYSAIGLEIGLTVAVAVVASFLSTRRVFASAPNQ